MAPFFRPQPISSFAGHLTPPSVHSLAWKSELATLPASSWLGSKSVRHLPDPLVHLKYAARARRGEPNARARFFAVFARTCFFQHIDRSRFHSRSGHMQPINRGSGTTRTERQLAKHADRTFLDLWSFPNTFNDRDIARGQGKEVCDLLVVCGDDVIIFSDKAISWPDTVEVSLAWSRWYKRAVGHSIDQIRGAERWLRKYPDRVFIDPQCKVPIPAALPPADRMRIHGVAVVSGAAAACRAYFGDKDGSLVVTSDPSVLESATNPHCPFPPFFVGDVGRGGSFIHVVDEISLPIMMRELDTITDFVEYLAARETALRAGQVGAAECEADLIAAYLQNEPHNGVRTFPIASQFGGTPTDKIFFPSNCYGEFKNSAAYRAKVHADRTGKSWDRLITLFSGNILAGTSVSVAGMETTVSGAEQSLRAMALERRVARRALGYAFTNALQEAEKQGKSRFARVILPTDGFADPELGYVFLIVAFKDDWLVSKGYDHYREGRAAFLKAYCQVALYQFPNLKRMVGIALDASPKLTGRKGGSEDLIMMQVEEWTPELIQETLDLQKEAEILVNANPMVGRVKTTEFFGSDGNSLFEGNRVERRKKRALARRQKGR